LYNPYTGQQNGQLAAELAMTVAGGSLRLQYSVGQASIDYQITIEAVSSNLGRGAYYLFLCPLLGERAKTLYSCPGVPRFAHRATLGVRYETQYVAGAFGAVLPFFKRAINAKRAFSSPYKKTWYGGKPTRWHLSALKALQKNIKVYPELLAKFRH
jgi:hypothetical protein